MDNLVILAFLASGFYGLIKGGDLLVAGGTQVARRLGVSTLVIGLTVIAWGTSAPEIVVSSLAAWKGSEEMSMGNVLGSNVANIGLVLGVCGLVLPAILMKRLAPREIFWLFASLGALWFVCLDGAITRVDGTGLIGLFLVYNVVLFLSTRGGAPEQTVEEAPGKVSPWLLLAVGTTMLAVGARLVVEGGERAANLFAVPQHVIGLTVFAVGTSLPELAAGLSGARRGETDISIGNVVGSNVFNLLVVVGIAALIQPFGVPGQVAHPSVSMALARDLPAILGFSALAVLLPWFGRTEGPKGGVWKGALLVLCYIAYIFTLFIE